MSYLVGQVHEPAANLTRAGVESACVLRRCVDATVTYEVAGTYYTDTIPAAEAVLWGTSATTQIDLTVDQHVTFIVPQHGGSAPLRVVPARSWPYVLAQGDALALDIVYMDRAERFQDA